jgi:hypothetical protein
VTTVLALTSPPCRPCSTPGRQPECLLGCMESRCPAHQECMARWRLIVQPAQWAGVRYPFVSAGAGGVSCSRHRTDRWRTRPRVSIVPRHVPACRRADRSPRVAMGLREALLCGLKAVRRDQDAEAVWGNQAVSGSLSGPAGMCAATGLRRHPHSSGHRPGGGVDTTSQDPRRADHRAPRARARAGRAPGPGTAASAPSRLVRYREGP